MFELLPWSEIPLKLKIRKKPEAVYLSVYLPPILKHFDFCNMQESPNHFPQAEQ